MVEGDPSAKGGGGGGGINKRSYYQSRRKAENKARSNNPYQTPWLLLFVKKLNLLAPVTF